MERVGDVEFSENTDKTSQFSDEDTFRCLECIFTTRIKQEFSEHIRCHEEGFKSPIFVAFIKNEPTEYPEDILESDDNFKEEKFNIDSLNFKCENSEYLKEECEIDSKTNIDKLTDEYVTKQDKKYIKAKPQRRRKWHQCTQCSYRTAKSSNLTRHITGRHTNERLAKCTKCDFSAKNMGDVKRHMLCKHTPKNIKWLPCDQCPYKAMFNGRLRQHIILKHTPGHSIKWVQCEHCAHKAKRKSDLYRHVRVHHSTSRDFKCNICDRDFNRRDHLNMHVLRKHTPDHLFKWYQCGQCCKKYKSNAKLKKHFIAKHSLDIDVKPA